MYEAADGNIPACIEPAAFCLHFARKHLDSLLKKCYDMACTSHGEVSERFKELVLKTSDSSRAKGSNPFLSATFFFVRYHNFIGKTAGHHLLFCVYGEVLKLVTRRPC